MPILKNAKKALRQSEARAEINRRVKSQVKNSMDKMKAEPTIATQAQAFSALDRALKRHLFHSNKVARVKSQLSKLLK